jgi:hypothetical protein
MLAVFRSHLTFANVVSLMALFVALSGGAYALTVPKNSIGARQLKKNAVTGAKIGKNAVTASKVKDGSLLTNDFKAGQIPAGPSGLQGLRGERGMTGASGATNVVVRLGAPESIGSGSQLSLTVDCQPGERAVGGGAAPPAGTTNDAARIIYSTPTTGGGNSGNGGIPNGWNTRVFNGAAQSQNAVPRVICASP